MKYSIIVYDQNDEFDVVESVDGRHIPYANLKWKNNELMLPIINIKNKEELRKDLNRFVDNLND